MSQRTSEIGPAAIGPKVSVITVCRNAATHIEEAMRSVREQTYGNLEHIVVDGASTDDTLRIIDRYPERISRLISEPDDGLYDAMNKGIAVAIGDYLFFLNADDRFADADAVADVMRFAADNGRPDLVYGQVLLDRPERPERRTYAYPLTRKVLAWAMVCHQAIFAARRVFERTGPFSAEYRVASDFEWLVKAVASGCSAGRVDRPICVVGTNGVTYRADWGHEKRQILRENYNLLEIFAWRTCPRVIRPWILRRIRALKHPSRPAGAPR